MNGGHRISETGKAVTCFSNLASGCGLGVCVSSSKETNGLGPAGEGGESGAGCEQASAKYLECMDTARGSKEAARSSHSHAEIQMCAGPVPLFFPFPLSRRVGLLPIAGGYSRHRARLYLLAECHSSAFNEGAWTGQAESCRRRFSQPWEGRMGPERSGGQPEGGPLQVQSWNIPARTRYLGTFA